MSGEFIVVVTEADREFAVGLLGQQQAEWVRGRLAALYPKKSCRVATKAEYPTQLLGEKVDLRRP